MSDDKCPNCGGELISRVSLVDYCLDCDTTIDASYWQTRAYVAEEHAKRSDAQVAALQAALEEEGHRNAVFTACLHKAQNLYLEAHPDYPGWPDGAVNITWVLEAFDKERAEVKRLRTALAAANEDAARLASSLENDAYPFPIRRSIDEKDAALRAHRARVGGGE